MFDSGQMAAWIRRMPRVSGAASSVPPRLASVMQKGMEVAPQTVGLTDAQVKSIWSSVEALYRTGMYPGLAFCIRRHGQTVLNRTLGYAYGNGPNDLPETPKRMMTLDTPICLFSASKMMTAMLIHKLMELGELNIMDPVSYYLPHFSIHGKRDVTLHQVMCHRAGIPMITDNLKPDSLFDSEYVNQLVMSLKPKWDSGQVVAYHAITGGYVLAKVAEKVTGKNVRELMHEWIQNPMGFKYMNFGLPAEHLSKRAWNYNTGLPAQFPFKQWLKRLLGIPLETVIELSNDERFQDVIIPAGNVMSTAEEVACFLSMLIDGGIYRQAGKKPVQVFDPLTVRRAVQPDGRRDVDRMFLVPVRYSAGFILGDDPVGLWGGQTARAFGHLGYSNHFCWADPERDISVALLTTGKPVLGPHLPFLVTLISKISLYCRRQAES
jgi:CubicO group peptidase (beta-lactamase class C family)